MRENPLEAMETGRRYLAPNHLEVETLVVSLTLLKERSFARRFWKKQTPDCSESCRFPYLMVLYLYNLKKRALVENEPKQRGVRLLL